MELDDLFARQPSLQEEASSPRTHHISNGNVVVPAQNRPTGRSPQQQQLQQQQQQQVGRARSQPDLDRGQARQGEVKTRHVTRVDIGEPERNSMAISPTAMKQFEYPDNHRGSAQRNNNIYAVPTSEADTGFDYARSGIHLPLPSNIIPPPPSGPAPEPPSPSSSRGEFVEINTNTPGYANVSGVIMRRQTSQPSEKKEESPYESSFRPGRNARLSKAPADLPVNRSRHSSNYSGSGSAGSGSDHSENKPVFSAHTHVMAYEKHSAHSDSGSDKQSVSFAEDKVYENAARFVQDHPDATVLMTSSADQSTRYYEPTPDYDEEETDTMKRRPASHAESNSSVKIETDVPPVKSLREQWQKWDGTSPARQGATAAAYGASERQASPAAASNTAPAQRSPADRPQSRPPPPPAPAQEERTMSAFGNAIKEAAMARERRAQEQEEREAIRLKEKQERQKRQAIEAELKAEQAREEAERQHQAEEKQREVSPAPPPPPVVAATTSSAEFKKSHTPPPQVQKQLEESRKREQSHTQLMAAIAKRRNYIDNVGSNNDALANDIDARIERAKSASPARVLKSDQQNIELVKETTPPKPIAPLPGSAASSRRSSLKREAPQPPSPKKAPAPAVPSMQSLPREQESKQEEVQLPTAGEEIDNFTARAERARQEWLKKKQAGTATLEKPQKPQEPKKTPEDEDNNNVTKKDDDDEDDDKDITQKRLSRGLPRDPKPPSSANRAVSPSGGGLGDLASIIAQKALQRQKTYEGDIDKDAGGPRGTQIVYGSQRSQNTNLSNGGPNDSDNALQKMAKSQSNRSIEIVGATVDSSNTESSPGHETNKPSVLQRTKMFETHSNEGNSYSVKSVTRSTGSKPHDNSSGDLPFDLPPPLVVGHNRHAGSVSGNYDRLTRRGADSDVVSNRNSMTGSETVGWVINSSPQKHSHEYAVRRKLANRNELGGQAGVDISGADDVGQMAVVDQHTIPALVDIVEVEVIPPPPLFDTDSDAIGAGFGAVPASNFQTAFSHEDNASMVSSLSTLSTLSSNEHDNQFAPDGIYQTHIQTQLSSPSSGYHSSAVSHPDEFYSELAPPSGFEVAPPPPGFDDSSTTPGGPLGYVDMQHEHHYEELSTIQEFIPPPCGFDASAPAGMELSTANSLKRNNAHRRSLRKKFEEKDITRWSVDDVADWLDSLNLSTHKQTFLRHQITGQNLTQMGRNELIGLGVTQVGDRMNIERAVKRALMNKL